MGHQSSIILNCWQINIKYSLKHPNSLCVPSSPGFSQISFFLCLDRICLSFSLDLDIPCSYINFIRLFLMYEKYISLKLFLSKILFANLFSG